MTPTSEALEGFYERVKKLDKALAKVSDAEVRKIELIQEIKNLSKEWLRLSEGLRLVEAIQPGALTSIDTSFQELFQSTDVRTRATAYRKRLTPVLAIFTDSVVFPLIRHEGSPVQVAARQVLSDFSGKVSPDEQSYLEEAVRCLSSKCNRAAIILLWAAAISRLHSSVEKFGFNAFNTAQEKTAQKKGNPYSRVSRNPINSLPELQNARDFDVIVIGMDLWKYDLQIYEELNRLLSIRNNAAHPGMLRPTALDVQQYAAKVAACVFDVVPS